MKSKRLLVILRVLEKTFKKLRTEFNSVLLALFQYILFAKQRHDIIKQKKVKNPLLRQNKCSTN